MIGECTKCGKNGLVFEDGLCEDCKVAETIKYLDETTCATCGKAVSSPEHWTCMGCEKVQCDDCARAQMPLPCHCADEE